MTEVPFQFLDDGTAVEHYLASLGTVPRLALDLEADGLFSYRENVCLIQISTGGDHCVLDPLTARSGLGSLELILADPKVEKILHGADFDIRLLKRDFGYTVRGLFDTMLAAQLCGRSQVGLAALLQEHFGVTLDKKYQKANWGKRPLDLGMLQYAALDTAHLLQLRDLLEEDLEKLGRLHWAKEEFRLLEAVEPAPAKPPDCFEVKGAGKLSPSQLSILQSLLEVRDRYAQQWDRPAFKVLPTSLLLAWAEKPPRNRSEVVAAEGANKQALGRLATPVLEAVQEARSTADDRFIRPSSEPPAPLTTAQEKRLKRLKKARLTRAEQLNLPVGLLVNTATLERLTRRTPEEAAEDLKGLLKNWQHEAVGEHLRKALAT